MSYPPPRKTHATLLAAVSDALDKPVALHRLLAEAIGFTAVSFALTYSILPTHSGVLSVLLVATALSGRFTSLLEKNRDDIWIHGRTSWDANRETAVRVMTIFAGIFLTYVAADLLLPNDRSLQAFGFAYETAHLADETMLTRGFGAWQPLFVHNSAVLASFVALSFVYRTYGVLLALAWNACVWATVITVLISRGALTYDGAVVWFLLIAAIAVLPHMLCEATAYIIGGLSAIFLSKALIKYRVDDAKFRAVLRAAGTMFVGAVALLLIASLLEQFATPSLLELL